MKLLPLCLLPLLFLIPEAEAGNCQIRPHYVQQYVAPTYVAPTTYVPSYYQNVLIVPQVIAVERNRDHYYSIDGAYQQSLLADAIVGRLLLAQAKDSGKIAPAGVAKPQAELASVSRGPSPYQEPKFLKILNDTCVKCHGAADKYPLVTADEKVRDCSEEYAWKIFGKVSTGEMPKTAKPLGDEDTKLFYEFVVAQKGRK